MEDIIDIIVTETTNLIEITSQPTDEIIDVNIIDNREDVTLNVTPTVVEININSLTGNFGVNWGEIDGTLSNQTDLQNALNLKADLVEGKVPSSQLPSYVDDVIEVANYASLPATGETGKIYVTIDTNYIYRWTGSVYVEIKDSSAVWGAITGTLSNQTDLQNALNLKANDNAVVHLAGAETITGAKTFSSAVTAPNFILSGGTGNTGLYYGHTDRVVLANYTAGGIDFEVNGGSIVATLFPSGNYGLGITLDAGYKLDVNGTTRISGALSGTSASFSSSITSSSIIKSGGTSSQFLKADGSVDSTSYQPLLTNPVTGTGTSGIVAVFNGTSSITDSSIYANSTRVSIGADVTTTNRFTAVSSTTSAYAVVAQASSAANGIWSNVLGTGEIFRGQTAGGSYFIINNGGNAFLNGNLNVGDFASTSYRLNVVGTANFTGALSGTSATFSGAIQAGGSIISGNSNNFYNTASETSVLIKQTSGAAFITQALWNNATTGDNRFIRFFGESTATNRGGIVYNRSSDKLNLVGEGGGLLFTGASTFSSTITSGDLITALGTSTAGFVTSLLVKNPSTNAASAVKIGFDGGGTTWGEIGASYNSNSPYMAFFVRANSEKMRITDAGNVGIGTTAPETITNHTSLTINGTSVSRMDYKVGGVKMGLVAATTSQFLIYSQGEFPLLLGTNDTERMRITSGGSVLVGTTSSLGFAMEVNGSIWAQKLRINDTASGYVTLEMENSSRWRINYLGRFSGYGAGTLTTDASGNISASSDRSLKDVIKPIENVLENIKDFEPVYFKWNDKTDLDKENVYMSTIAQSIQKHYPDAVGKMADGTLTVQDRAVTAILVQAIKELKAELDTLKNK